MRLCFEENFLTDYAVADHALEEGHIDDLVGGDQVEGLPAAAGLFLPLGVLGIWVGDLHLFCFSFCLFSVF